MYIYKIKEELKRKLADTWYFLMKPIAYFFTSEKLNARYNKKKEKITKDQAIKWIAEDIVRYLIKRKNSSVDILVCEYADDDYFWRDCTLTGTCPYYLKRDKTRMAFYKFNIDIEFQEKVIEYVKMFNVVKVTEQVEEFTWQNIKKYKKSVTIKLR